eukprot:TRINITY_DN33979_c0_g1_i1.p1 TRINITY_DN33979_c0_g1~~TRINITY_DN33979_c0_g1_i1.p1  ORF type:complete len:1629 (+),score=292.31 TRINITY_DN33979_c0_g1_i1:82-4968(+)
MGKKTSGKKKGGGGVDLRGYATTSVAKKEIPKAEEEEEECDVGVVGDDRPEDVHAASPSTGVQESHVLSIDADAATGESGKMQCDDELEEWERVDELVAESNVEPTQNGTTAPAGLAELGELKDHEWENALEIRLDEEMRKCLDRRYAQPDLTAQFERRKNFQPAGVALFSSVAERRMETALGYLRDGEDDSSRMFFPKEWRYRGKQTYTRLSNIYLALESMSFKGEQIRQAMEKTYGYDQRAALEYLLVTLPREALPRHFGGESTADGALAAEEATDETCMSDARPEQMSTVAINEGDEAAAIGRLSETDAAMVEGRVVDQEANPLAPLSEASDKSQHNEPAIGLADAKTSAIVGGYPSASEKSSRKDSKAEQGEKIRKSDSETKVNITANDFNKRWAAQYCSGGGSDSDELLDEEQLLEREKKKDPTGYYVKISKQCDDLMMLCKKLKDKKKQGAFKQNISADMEKQRDAVSQIVKLQSEKQTLESGKYGKLDQERIEKEKPTPKARAAKPVEPKPPKAAPTEPTVDVSVATASPSQDGVDEVEEDVELPSLFDGDDTLAGGLSNGQAIGEVLKACRVYNIAGWHGKTARGMLEEFARKRIWGKSPPDKVLRLENMTRSTPGRYYSKVSLHQPKNRPTHVFTIDEPCETARDADNLVSMFAFYKLSEEHERAEFTRKVHPLFKQRMQEWADEDAARAREVMRERIRSRVTFVEQLLRKNPPVGSFSASAPGIDAAARGRGEGGYDEDEDFVVLDGSAAAKLRSDFAKRRGSLSDRDSFQAIQEQRGALPVADYRERLLRSIKCSGVLIVSGATGSGKTTQVPQYVLEDALSQDSCEPLPNIIVTEPRRISAVSVAKRVSQELGDPSGGPGSRGSLVGYQIRLEKKASESTRLLFCTVGVLLKRVQQSLSSISRVTHIFIDEVHERSADVDLLLFLLRQLRYTRTDLRIIVMSATLEVKKLASFFANSAPHVDIPGRTFPVETYWLEDVVEMTGYQCGDGDGDEFAKRGFRNKYEQGQRQTFKVSAIGGKSVTLSDVEDDDIECDDEAESCDGSKYHPETAKALVRMDHTRINYRLIALTLEYIEQCDHFNEVPREDGAVLIFLPGLGEISKAHDYITRSPILGDSSRFIIISLHSVLSGEDHQKAFVRAPFGMRKIVLSTNIAETGVTIPDVIFVIDTCKAKCQQYHEPSNTSSLTEKFISRAEVVQRRGRAGRVRAGFCFTLATLRRFELRFHELPTPEILRCSLMELMLSALSSGLQPSCFAQCIDPPPKTRIDQAVATLRSIGAVEEGQRPANAVLQFGPVSSDEAWIVPTPVGLCLAKLPCDVRLGKMLLLSALFGGVDPVLSIAATLSHRSPLATPFSESRRAQARSVHCTELLPKGGPPSDHLALHAAYSKWEHAKKKNTADSLCHKLWLNGQVMQAIKEIRQDLLDSLKSEGYCETYTREEITPEDLRSASTVTAILFAGLFPNVARVDAPPHATNKVPLFLAGSEHIKLHPGSLCRERTEGLHRTNHRWICYHTKMKTTQVFLRDCSFLTPNALLLFGGDTSSINIHPIEKTVSIGNGGERHWHAFYAASRSVAMVRQLRYAFDSMLRRKATNPRCPLTSEDRAVVAAYVAVINSDGS